MYSWLKTDSEKEEEPEVTWSEFTQLFLEQYKCVHVSEYDREEKPIVYTDVVPSFALSKLLIEQFCPEYQTNGVSESAEPDENGETEEQDEEEESEQEIPVLPITLLTCFYIQTHKGELRLLSNTPFRHQTPIYTTLMHINYPPHTFH